MKLLYTLWALMLSAYSLFARSTKAALYLFFPLLFSGMYTVRAEGTKEIMPSYSATSTNATGLIVSTLPSFPLGNVGSYVQPYDPLNPGLFLAPKDNRIAFRIKNYLTEKLYYGFNWEALSPSGNPAGTPYKDVYMLIYDPNGNQVGVPILLPSTATPGAGLISTWSSAFFGPNIGGSPSAGYTPLTFAPSMNGDYTVSFYRSSSGGAKHDVQESMLSKYFDMTVAQTVAGVTTTYKGRVHCNEWAFSVYNPSSSDIQDPLSSSNASFYTYTPDSVVVKVYFPATGFQPLTFIVAFNSFGVINGGNWPQDRRSIVLQQLVPPYLSGGYDVFLNQPDATLWPPCVLPQAPSLVTPTIAGCPPGPYNVRFKAPQPGDYYILFDLNGTSGYQANSADRFIELINQTPGIINYVWDGKDGLGNPVPANTSFPITFSFRKGRINIPIYDAELNVNGFSVDGVAPVLSLKTQLYWDDSKIVSVGNDCTTGTNGYSANNNNYTGIGYDNSIVGQKAPAHAWNGDGNQYLTVPAPAVVYGGTRNDKDNVQCNDFGNARLINTWAWGIDDTVTQTLTLTCISVKGKVWDDADGSAGGSFSNTIPTNAEVGTSAGNLLYANLIDPISGTVLASAPVNADGTYTLNNCPQNATGMQVVISTTAGTFGSSVAALLPSNWTNTSPLARSFDTYTSNITGIDFGIEQLPNATLQNYYIAVPTVGSSVTLNGFSTITSPGPLAGADPEDGTMGSGKKAVITQIPSNEELYYNNVLVTNNTVIPNYSPALLRVKFININVMSTAFTYAWMDAAGKQGSANTYTINMATVLATSLTSFTGRNADAGNVLNWTGTNETNGVYFTVERSSDGSSFTPIGRVDGVGNGATANHSFTDTHPIAGLTNYYRLVMSDLSGGASYSNVINIGPAGGSAVVEVAPNPFQDVINVNLNLTQPEKISLRLLDSKGMLLRQTEYGGFKGANTLQLGSLGSLPVSIYFIQIVLPDQVFVRKVFNR